MKQRPAIRKSAATSRWVRSVAMGRIDDSWRGWNSAQRECALELASGHALVPRCGANLSEGGLGKEPIFAPWIAAWRRWMGQEVLLAQALGEIVERCRAAGVALLAIKGSDLSVRLYGPGQRPRTDIDLVVSPTDFKAVDSLLFKAGFSPSHPDSALAHAHWFATTYRWREHPGVVVDLHWDLGRPGRTHWRMRDVFDRAEAFPGCSGLLRLDQRDLAVHLALHAVAFHGGSGRWIWWLDQALLHQRFDRSGRGAWEGVYERARQVGGVVALDAARLRATQLFVEGSACTPPVSRRARWASDIGRRLEGGRAGTLGRWLVAALAVDRWSNFGRIALDVGRRGTFRIAARSRRSNTRR